MIEKKTVADLAEAYLESSECYLVDVTVSSDNLIVVEIDHDKGVSIDDCTELSQYIEKKLNRDVEDYELQVTSAGLTTPFKIVRQYQKNIGGEVEVLLRNGKKMVGILKSADDNSAVITVTKQVKREGAKRKETVQEDMSYKYEEIKYTKNIIRFK